MLPFRIINLSNQEHLRMATNFGYQVINVCRPTDLGNPYPLTDESQRDNAIEMYRRWLWDRMKAHDKQLRALRDIERAWREHGRVALACYCAPRKCHADIIARAVIWLINNDKPTTSASELDQLKYRFERFDWSYEMSDDGRVWRKGSSEQAALIKAVGNLNTKEFMEVRKVKIPRKPQGESPDFALWARILLLSDIETPSNLLDL